jgi:hypothetical protein
MKKVINARLFDLLEILEARAMINIFVEDNGEQKSVKYLKVYEFLSEPELMRKYKNYEVIGLQVGLTTNILIKEA